MLCLFRFWVALSLFSDLSDEITQSLCLIVCSFCNWPAFEVMAGRATAFWAACLDAVKESWILDVNRYPHASRGQSRHWIHFHVMAASLCCSMSVSPEFMRPTIILWGLQRERGFHRPCSQSANVNTASFSVARPCWMLRYIYFQYLSCSMKRDIDDRVIARYSILIAPFISKLGCKVECVRLLAI